MQDCDSPSNNTEHSNVTDMDMDFHQPVARPEIATYARSSNTYSTQQRAGNTANATADDRWSNNSGSGGSTSNISGNSSNNSNNLFNKVYYSGR